MTSQLAGGRSTGPRVASPTDCVRPNSSGTHGLPNGALEHGLPGPDDAEIENIGLDRRATLEHQHEPLPVVGCPGDPLAGQEAVDGKLGELPTSRRRIDRDDQAVRVCCGGAKQERPRGRRAKLAHVRFDSDLIRARLAAIECSGAIALAQLGWPWLENLTAISFALAWVDRKHAS